MVDNEKQRGLEEHKSRKPNSVRWSCWPWKRDGSKEGRGRKREEEEGQMKILIIH